MGFTEDIAQRHTAAISISRHAGALALDYFNHRDRLTIDTKQDDLDVVSIADQEVERRIRRRITEQFPDDGIIGEEHAPTPGQSGYTWVIDPIDGTMPFLSGLPTWCVAIALVSAGETVAAVTYAPVIDQCYEVIGGEAFKVNGCSVWLDNARDVHQGMTAIGASHRSSACGIGNVMTCLLAAGGVHYRTGSGALMLAEVACGRLVGYFEPFMSAWDCLGGLLMVETAGGKIEALDMPRMLKTGHRVIAGTQTAFPTLETMADAYDQGWTKDGR